MDFRVSRPATFREQNGPPAYVTQKARASIPQLMAVASGFVASKPRVAAFATTLAWSIRIVVMIISRFVPLTEEGMGCRIVRKRIHV